MALHLIGMAPHWLSHLASYLTLIKFEVASHYHLNPPEFLALTAITIRGQLSFKELRQTLAMPKSTLTVVVDSLQQKHMVRRQRSRRDRRRWSVRLTSEGARLFQEMSQQEAQALVRRLEGMPPRELEAMRAALEALATLAPPS